MAAEKNLSDPKILRAQTERKLADSKAERFIVDFTNQWLDLRLIDDNTPHSRLYPEFSPLLPDSMVGETRAFLRKLLRHDLPAANIVDSDFAMLNQALAAFYGDFDLADFAIPQEKPRPKQPRDALPRPVTSAEPIVGFEFRRIPLPPGSQRDGLFTQAAILKVTANGTLHFEVKCESDNQLVLTFNCNAWGAMIPGKPAVDYTAVKELKGSSDWQTVSVSLNELIATDPKVTTTLANWQTVTEFSISPSGTTVKDGQKMKAAGKAWQGPREIRNLRWVGGEYARQKNVDSALRPEEFQKNFNDAIRRSLEQEKANQTVK